MIKLKLTTKKGECWEAVGTYTNKKLTVELPAVFLLKPTDKGLEVVLNDPESPCTLDNKVIQGMNQHEEYPIPFEKALKKGVGVDIATENISQFKVQKN